MYVGTFDSIKHLQKQEKIKGKNASKSLLSFQVNWMHLMQSHYINVAQGGASSRAVHNLL